MSKVTLRIVSFFLFFLCFGQSSTALAATFASRYEQATERLEQGEVAQALQAYRELQVDYPEYLEVQFGLGCALYAQALSQQGEDALAGLRTSAAVFERVTSDAQEPLRRHAAFNHANSVAQWAKQVAPTSEEGQHEPKRYNAGVAALREAVSNYEELLKSYPDDSAVQQNLDHVRYMLKRLLQNPPDTEREESTPPQSPPEQQKAEGVFTLVGTDLPEMEVVVEGMFAVLRGKTEEAVQ